MRLDPSDSKVLFNLWVTLCAFLVEGETQPHCSLRVASAGRSADRLQAITSTYR
ncbi:hypothetical protein LEP1GSC055_1224 [Leptospira borgpetersenii str. Brem 307]|nr:hypothetical protein LEP1GSC055_1224 [Leptospira borgpetersenii str. Brem 307]